MPAFLFLAIVFLFHFPANAGTSTQETMKRLQSVYRDMTDLTMQFKQTSSIEGFGEKVFDGTLYLKKPGLMRWDYLKPAKQNVFVTGEKVILHMPEQKQAIIQNISDHPDAEPAMGLLSNIDQWEELFNIEAKGEGEGSLRIELRPKAMFFVEKVLVEIDRKSAYITGLILFEKSGNRVSFAFSDIRKNTGIKDHLFNFQVPKGTEVLEY